eukprot:1801027-Amphidinium_carterae.1
MTRSALCLKSLALNGAGKLHACAAHAHSPCAMGILVCAYEVHIKFLTHVWRQSTHPTYDEAHSNDPPTRTQLLRQCKSQSPTSEQTRRWV